MKHPVTVVGAVSHYGLVELVSVRVEDGAPRLLDRRGAKLNPDGLPGSPYHHQALELPLEEAEALVERVEASVARLTHAALTAVRSEFAPAALVLEESPYARLPTALADILASWPMTCAADGMMYREAVAAAAAEAGMEVIRYPRKTDEVRMAAEAIGAEPDAVTALIRGMGKAVGVPWRKDHRIAAAAALFGLARFTQVRV